MEIRSSQICGLAEDDPGPVAVPGIFTGTLAVLLLAVLYAFSAPDNHPMRSFYHPPDGYGAASAQAAAFAEESAPQTLLAYSRDQALAINESLPFSPEPNPAARPFKLMSNDIIDHARAQTCLTMAVYYEAAGQGAEGEAAVAQVVLNRLRHPSFPKTVCGVVFQGSSLATGCQFTFTCDGSLSRIPNPVGWKEASLVAERALNGHVEALVGDATHYHTVWVVPSWQSTVEKVVQIGAHVFFRWSGPAGDARAFNGVYAGAEPPLPTVGGKGTPDSQLDTAVVTQAGYKATLAASQAESGTARVVSFNRPIEPTELAPIHQPPVLQSANAAALAKAPTAPGATVNRLAMPSKW
jgi:hypothetical protein